MRKITENFLLILFACIFAIGLAEIILSVAGLPPEPLKPHSAPPQFRITPGEEFGYVNIPSTDIVFKYDSNPRNYFGPQNEVIHTTNAIGFRGPLRSREKKQGTFRISFLGDSFTFGEGVHFEDTYPRRIERALQTSTRPVESLNFGVGGYNTSQEAALFKSLVLKSTPDVVVLGYTMNDAEPALFYFDKTSNQFVRRQRELMVHEGGANPVPPDNVIYKLRFARLIWQYFALRDQTSNTINWYKSLYKANNPNWKETQAAISEIGDLCKSNNITCAAVIFPLLHQLDDYPLYEEHNKIKHVLEKNNFLVIDLLPLLEGRDAQSLWVHPTDQHPNEIVHDLAAEAVVSRLRQEGIVD